MTTTNSPSSMPDDVIDAVSLMTLRPSYELFYVSYIMDFSSCIVISFVCTFSFIKSIKNRKIEHSMLYNQELDERNVKLLQLEKYLKCKICVFGSHRQIQVVINVKRMLFTYGQAISFTKVSRLQCPFRMVLQKNLWFFVL